MPDRRENPTVPDLRRVNIHEEHELKYWTKELGIREKDLKQAVMEVGTSAEAVKIFRRKKSKITSFVANELKVKFEGMLKISATVQE